jgi:hypothetical protein
MNLKSIFAPKRSKYNVGPKEGRTVDGHTFASAAEAARYMSLAHLQRIGAISDLRLQPGFLLAEKFVHPAWGSLRALTYVADFSYKEISATKC